MPLSPVVLSEIEQAATRNGYPADAELRGDWLLLRSPWTRHGLLATHDGRRFLVAPLSPAVAEEAARERPALPGAPQGAAAVFAAATSADLHALVQRLYQLARSLPPEPLDAYLARTRHLPRTTEAERLVVQRVGQTVFRDSLMDYWNGRCPFTGIDQPELLRASHIKPWAECESDAERLDVHNGLLLAAHLDAAFDAHLISVSDEGRIIVSPRLRPATREALDLDRLPSLRSLRPAHLGYLALHRRRLLDLTTAARPD